MQSLLKEEAKFWRGEADWTQSDDIWDALAYVEEKQRRALQLAPRLQWATPNEPGI